VAEENYPTNYNNSVEWYKDFIAWLEVSKDAQLETSGEKAVMC
jgi:hypothetical protein